ncbi:iron ABC transporter permease [Labrys sp. KNU-23]|uniref:FecCD family ABC transporter permease n=1 Tax=Labrys sp. KNU-23 TaxID=2789216 RepID=UPI0011EFF39B|nr:iron ABC transporter permease [Labrys sp. KNU-23]QEN89637.1 iron ABC transporter permease [Labrys sp. KNU-23]
MARPLPPSPPAARGRLAVLVLGAPILVAITAIFLGVSHVAPADVLAALMGQGSRQANLIVADFRVPRVITGILAGIHFALAGLLLQNITRNPLADPTLMGVSQGATLAVTLFLFATVYGSAGGSNMLYQLPVAWLPAAGLIGGLVAGGIIYLLALRRDLGPLRITLCGIAVGAVLHALAIGLITGWGSARIEILLEWLSGSLYARSWEHVLFLLPFTLAGLVILPFLHRSITMLQFEAPVARSFGLDYRRHFTLVLMLACGLAASAVGAVGPLVFVGLVVPHLARMLAGRRGGAVLPLTILLGAMLVTAADLVGRLIGQADEIPIGVVTAIGGAPILVILLRRLP